MLIDAESLERSSRFDCDLCIIGSGPAGMAIADHLRQSKLSIVVLEGGGTELELKSQRLYAGQTSGDPYFRLDSCRWRVMGGSTGRWGGWCRAMDPEDFTSRGWLPYSGWPIAEADLTPFYIGASRMLELPNASFEIDDWQARMSRPIPLEQTNFENTIFQFSREKNMPLQCRQRIISAPNVKTLIHANVTEIRLDPISERVGSISAATLTGKSLTVHPRAAVLATGGIENARLLLASRADRAAGLGNEFDTVGRFFMEHIHVPVGHLLASPRLFESKFYRRVDLGDARLRGLVTPSVAAREKFGLPTTSIAIEKPSFSFGTPFVGWPPVLMFSAARRYQRLRERGFDVLAERMRQFIERAEAVPRFVASWRNARAAQASANCAPGDQIYSLYFRAEQVPDPQNRVVLSGRRDVLGVPMPELQWRINPLDEAGVTGWLEVFADDIRTRGLGQVIGPLEDWKAAVTGGPHHMGTTRMAQSPRLGVVDGDCRVHSVKNLYVAGSSVFATGSYVNPTFTLVALALRLAETLRKKLSAVQSIVLDDSV